MVRCIYVSLTAMSCAPRVVYSQRHSRPLPAHAVVKSAAFEIGFCYPDRAVAGHDRKVSGCRSIHVTTPHDTVLLHLRLCVTRKEQRFLPHKLEEAGLLYPRTEMLLPAPIAVSIKREWAFSCSYNIPVGIIIRIDLESDYTSVRCLRVSGGYMPPPTCNGFAPPKMHYRKRGSHFWRPSNKRASNVTQCAPHARATVSDASVCIDRHVHSVYMLLYLAAHPSCE